MEEVYKYCGAAGVQSLWSDELMASPIEHFNDPFECYPASIASKEPGTFFQDITKHLSSLDRQYCQKLQELGSQAWFVICLSRVKNNVRMWSQYAELHKGLMLTLDVERSGLKESLVEVEYDQPRVIMPSEMGQSEEEQTEPLAVRLRKLISRKGPDWEQEDECRALLHADQLGMNIRELPSDAPRRDIGNLRWVEGSLRGFAKIPAESITRVTLGWKSSMELQALVKRIKAFRKAPWDIVRAAPSKQGFSLEEHSV